MFSTEAESAVKARGSKKNTAARRNQTLPCLSCRRHDKRRNSQPTSDSGAISHSRAGFASEKRKERTCVRDLSGERRKARSGKYKIPPSGGLKRYLACRAGGTTKGSTASSPESGAISHSRAGFASEKRVECTYVLDTSGKRSKARSGKARSLRVKKRVRRCCSSGGKRRPVRQAIQRK